MNKKQLTVKKLDINNLADVMKLQEKIISGLHPDEQHFILHRTAEDYMKSLDGKSSNMLGVFDGDTLIAQTVYSLPLNGETRDMKTSLLPKSYTECPKTAKREICPNLSRKSKTKIWFFMKLFWLTPPTGVPA